MSSEEKELPASQQKLRRARERGEVARSPDLNAAAVLIAAVIHLATALGPLVADLVALWSQPLDFRDGARGEALQAMATGLASIAAGFAGPLLLFVIVATVFAELVMKRGIVLSFEPVMPKFTRINPVSGFQNLFSLRRLIDLIKALFKLALLGGSGVVVVLGTLGSLMWLPRCGVACTAEVWGETTLLLAGLAIVIFAVNGLVDMRLQSWLFLRDQRMTKTESKQEAKNMNQNPAIKRALRQQARQGGGTRTPVAEASLVIGDGGVAIAVRFVEDEMPAPVCIAKARGAAAKRLVVEAERHNVPVHQDMAFVNTFFDETQPMGYMPMPSYPLLAQIMKQHGLL